MSIESTAQQTSKFNNLVNDSARQMGAKVRAAFARYDGGTGNGDGRRRLKVGTRKKDGEVFKIYFKMPRHLVFFHKGVGRGRGINSSKKTPKPFLNEVLEQEIPILQGQLATHFQGRMINDSKILIQ